MQIAKKKSMKKASVLILRALLFQELWKNTRENYTLKVK
jgi:hypothetical protein